MWVSVAGVVIAFGAIVVAMCQVGGVLYRGLLVALALFLTTLSVFAWSDAGDAACGGSEKGSEKSNGDCTLERTTPPITVAETSVADSVMERERVDHDPSLEAAIERAHAQRRASLAFAADGMRDDPYVVRSEPEKI